MAFIHQHRRKRVYKNLEPYPHHKLYFKILDATVSIVALISPFASLPQVLDIWVDRKTEGVSLLTWSLFLVGNFPLLLYAIAHKDWKLTTMFLLSILVNLAVILGIILL